MTIVASDEPDAASAATSCAQAAEPTMIEVLRLDIGADAELIDTEPTYSLDRRGQLATVGRVTYCLELDGTFAAATFDAPDQNPALLGVPVTDESDAQGRIAVTVVANVAGVPTGDDLSGSIEFYPYNYTPAQTMGVPGASGEVYDADDLHGQLRHGAMQIHAADPATGAPVTVFAYNRWAFAGVDDLGIGNNDGVHPDWTFEQNADQYASARLRVFASEAAGSITDPGALQTGGIVPREPGATAGRTFVEGVAPNADQVRASTFYDGATKRSRVRDVAPDGSFVIPIDVPARQRSHTAMIEARVDGTWARVYTVADVAGGDVYLVQGQSNAVARVFGGGIGAEAELASPWIRTFGSSSRTHAPDSMSWTEAGADNGYGVGEVGQWGLTLGAELLRTTGVPVAVINGADGGKPASFFQRNAADPLDPATNYGRFLERLQRSGVDQSAMVIGWYQGESDHLNPEPHRQGVNALFDDWLADLPSLERIHLVQIHNGCRSRDVPDGDLDVREVQRQISLARAEVDLVSTVALPDHDGCHYTPDGYRALGVQLARLTERDVLGASVPSGIDSPVAVEANLQTGPDSVVRVRFDSVDRILPSGTTEFSISDGTAVVEVIGGPGTVDLVLASTPAPNSTVRYLGVASPWPTTAWGAALAAFDGLPIGTAQPPDPVIGCVADAAGLRWESVAGVDTYQVRRDGRWLATSSDTTYTTSTTGHEFVIRYRSAGATVDIDCQAGQPTGGCDASDGLLRWDPVPGADTYQVRRDGRWLATTGGTTYATTTTGHSFVIRHRINGSVIDVDCE